MWLKHFIAIAMIASLVRTDEARGQWHLIGSPGPNSFLQCGKNLIAGSYWGILSSTDDGMTWTGSENKPRISNRYANFTDWLGVHAFTRVASIVFAGTADGVYRSLDEGLTWSLCSKSAHDPVVALTSIGSVLLAGTVDSGVYRSTDGGDSWQQANVGLTTDTVTFGSLAATVLVVKNSRLYCVVYHTAKGAVLNRPQGIFVSTDSGMSWVGKNEGLRLDTSYHMEDDSKVVNAIVFSKGFMLAGTGSGVFQSTDWGDHWILEASDPTLQSLVSVGDILLKGYVWGGTYRSSDRGTSWTKVSPINAKCFYVNDTFVYTVDYFSGSISRSTDSGNSWSEVAPVESFSVNSILTAGKNLFIGSIGILRSNDHGLNWIAADSGISASGVNALAMSADKIYAGTDTGVFFTTDAGMSWESCEDSGLWCNKVKSLVSVGSNIFACAIQYTVHPNQNPRYPPYVQLTGSGVFRSTNDGETWLEVKNFLPDSLWSVQLGTCGLLLFADRYYSSDFGDTWAMDSIAPDFTTMQDGYAFSHDKGSILISSNCGAGWSKLSDYYPLNSAAWAANRQHLFAGTVDSGVFLLDPITGIWSQVNSGILDTEIAHIFLDDSFAYAVGGSNSRLWRRPISEMIGSQSAVHGQPQPTDQLRIYPNPATEFATISFTLHKAGYVDISIVKLLGVEVAHLFSGELDAGEHSFTWEPQAKACATPGVYECVVRMNGHMRTLPIVLAR